MPFPKLIAPFTLTGSIRREKAWLKEKMRIICNWFLSLELGGEREEYYGELLTNISSFFLAASPNIASKAIQTNFQSNSNGSIQTNFD